MARKPEPINAFRASSSFAVPGPDGLPRVIREGDIVAEDDPVVKTNRGNLQPMTEHIEQATKAPGEVRPIRIPSGVTAEEATKARDVRNGPRNTQGEDMPHALPPEHEDSPASPFAPGQPAAGVVADDVPPEQNPAGGPKAADAPTIENTQPESQTAQQAANAESHRDANRKSQEAANKRSAK